MAKLHFSKKEAISYGYDTTKKNIKFFVILLVIAGAIYITASSIQSSLNENYKLGVIAAVISILVWILNTILEMGLMRIALDFVEKKKTGYKRLFYTDLLFDYLLMSVIRLVFVIVGLVFLVVPGIILAIKLQYAGYFILDKKLGFWEAMRQSWSITKGIKWNLFLLGLLLAIINIGGMILLFVGLIFTIPLSLLTNAYVFKKLQAQLK